MEALQSSSFIKRDPIICCCGWAGRIHCMIVVTNRAQRCETHKLALFLVGGRVKVSRAVSVVAILVKNNTAREFLKDLPPTQRYVRTCAVDRSANGSASVQQLYQKRSHHLLLRVGGQDSLHDCVEVRVGATGQPVAETNRNRNRKQK